jgi:TonB family protein
VLFALAAALGVHAVAIFILRHVDFGAADRAAVAQALAASKSSTDDQPLEISTLVDSLDRPEEPTPEEKKREEKKKKEEEAKEPHGQVVDLARPAVEERPDEARFVSEYDSKVDKEKRHNGRDKAGATVPPTPPPSAPPSGAAQNVEAARGGRAGRPEEARSIVAMREQGHDGHVVDEDGTFKRRTGLGHDDAEREASSRPSTTAPSNHPNGENGDDKTANAGARAGQPRPNLTASPEMLERAIGAGQGSMDYLKDIDDGDSTALNAKKWKFSAFFNRMKRAVAQEWHPDVVYVQHDPSGNVYGVKDRVTVLRVSLKPDGHILATNVVQSSGVFPLDDEAIAAFQRAQPFQNPPKDLVGSDGEIHFSFAFIFELSGRTSTKVYRYH